jgi:hypothetical protein
MILDSSEFYIDPSSFFEIDLDKYIERGTKHWIHSDSEKLCHVLFDYLNDVE